MFLEDIDAPRTCPQSPVFCVWGEVAEPVMASEDRTRGWRWLWENLGKTEKLRTFEIKLER